MSFEIRNLSVVSYSNGFTLWHYKAGIDYLFNIGCVGFFNDASDMMSQGDMILVSSADGGRQLYVTLSDHGCVDTTAMLATQGRVAKAA